MFLNFITNGGTSLMAPFYPDVARQKGVKDIYIGNVFGIFNVGAFISAIIFGKMMKFWGRKLILTLGLLLVGSMTLIYGLIIYVEDLTFFIILSLICRFFEGVGCSAYSAIAYAYIPILYPNDVDYKIG